MQDFIHGYEIEAVLQERGNARVFLIKEEDVFIVMKTIVAQTKRDCNQFIREIKCLQKLKHPNVISIKKSFDQPLAFTMPYVEGVLLRDLIDGGLLSTKLVEKITTKLFIGLHYVHQKGILHCDLKPENIIIQEDGEPVIFDFGLNQGINETIDLVLGSTRYMPVEVVSGEGWTVQGEVYALGMIFQEMFEENENQSELAGFYAIMEDCLKEKEHRPKDCAEVLQRIKDIPDPNQKKKAKKKTKKSSSDLSMWIGILIVILVALVIVLLLK